MEDVAMCTKDCPAWHSHSLVWSINKSFWSYCHFELRALLEVILSAHNKRDTLCDAMKSDVFLSALHKAGSNFIFYSRSRICLWTLSGGAKMTIRSSSLEQEQSGRMDTLITISNWWASEYECILSLTRWEQLNLCRWRKGAIQMRRKARRSSSSLFKAKRWRVTCYGPNMVSANQNSGIIQSAATKFHMSDAA